MTEFTLQSHSYDGRYLFVSCTQEQNVAENKSVIHWTLTVTGGNSPCYTTGPTTLLIGGQRVYYAPIAYYNVPQFPAAKGSVSGSLEIEHLPDGSKSVECTLETAIYTGVLKTARATWELDAIPRASTVQATDCFIGGTCMVLVDRKSSLYTHTVSLHTDVLEGYLGPDGSITSQPVKLESVQMAFSVPLSFYEKIPDSRKIACRLVCTTYAEDRQIGESQECTFYAFCREEDCAPIVEGQVTDGNGETLALTADENTLVRFFSRAVCRISAQPRNGAVIVKMQVNGEKVAAEEVEFPNVEQGVFLFQATDSRGFSTQIRVEKPLLPYRKLTANYTVQRESPTSDRVALTVFGDFWAGDFGARENSLTVLCRVGEQEIPLEMTLGEESYTATATVEGLPYDRTEYLTVEVEDALMSYSLSVSVKPGVPVFDWGEKDFAFHVPVTLSDGAAAISQAQLMSLLSQLGLITEKEVKQ